MLYWAAIFLTVAAVAGAFGFGGMTMSPAVVAQMLFFIFVVLFVLSLLVGLVRRGGGSPSIYP